MKRLLFLAVLAAMIGTTQGSTASDMTTVATTVSDACPPGCTVSDCDPSTCPLCDDSECPLSHGAQHMGARTE
jgi:hypothetical protein